ncbi:hypothetical protein BDV41DRAFT_542064 [Aspergillus transmontanensis]|uniref:Uncharacterized protein n=1 Tax=Aspergillus transmontanensis TaxID=1034304 RepID=A0A5N6VS13_9EURO|nr:hypothetical protein BDV41DRAFT_542064 [Aspergillus transmontanensis]
MGQSMWSKMYSVWSTSSEPWKVYYYYLQCFVAIMSFLFSSSYPSLLPLGFSTIL